MAQSGFKPAEVESDRLNPEALGPSGPGNGQGDDHEDSAPSRGVVAVDMAREVVARFSGTLLLKDLPERQPEIVFERGRLSRDDLDG